MYIKQERGQIFGRRNSERLYEPAEFAVVNYSGCYVDIVFREPDITAVIAFFGFYLHPCG